MHALVVKHVRSEDMLEMLRFLVVSISARHAEDPGSSPGQGQLKIWLVRGPRRAPAREIVFLE